MSQYPMPSPSSPRFLFFFMSICLLPCVSWGSQDGIKNPFLATFYSACTPDELYRPYKNSTTVNASVFLQLQQEFCREQYKSKRKSTILNFVEWSALPTIAVGGLFYMGWFPASLQYTLGILVSYVLWNSDVGRSTNEYLATDPIPTTDPLVKYERKLIEHGGYLPGPVQWQLKENMYNVRLGTLAYPAVNQYIETALDYPFTVRSAEYDEEKIDSLVAGFPPETQENLKLATYAIVLLSKSTDTTEPKKFVMNLSGPGGVGKSYIARRLMTEIGLPPCKAILSGRGISAIRGSSGRDGSQPTPGEIVRCLKEGSALNTPIIFDDGDRELNENSVLKNAFLNVVDPAESALANDYFGTDLPYDNGVMIITSNLLLSIAGGPYAAQAPASSTQTITDAQGKELAVPDTTAASSLKDPFEQRLFTILVDNVDRNHKAKVFQDSYIPRVLRKFGLEEAFNASEIQAFKDEAQQIAMKNPDPGYREPETVLRTHILKAAFKRKIKMKVHGHASENTNLPEQDCSLPGQTQGRLVVGPSVMLPEAQKPASTPSPLP